MTGAALGTSRRGARVSGVVLAAGAGSRLGRPKAELVVRGERLLDRAVRVLREGGCDEVIAVVRPGGTAPEPWPVPSEARPCSERGTGGWARTVVNPDPRRGLGSSLRLGLAAATGQRAVIMLVDTPGVPAAAVRAVLVADAPVAVASYGGRRGHPVVLAAGYWERV
ncbi:MAG: NTP transferase domain-containing protein, partial [Actinomycetia bacterium]|nr:NTP transferase domain-containing protein [Actinomycetes bacterium]